jgi:hypothetical protein
LFGVLGDVGFFGIFKSNFRPDLPQHLGLHGWFQLSLQFKDRSSNVFNSFPSKFFPILMSNRGETEDL